MPRFDPVTYMKQLEEAFARRDGAIEQASIFVRVGDKTHRIDASEVASIDSIPETTPLPGAHSWVSGLANIKGRVTVIANLERLISGDVSSPPKYCLSLRRYDYALAVMLSTTGGGEDGAANRIDLETTIPESPYRNAQAVHLS